jgi:hypothetical protein
MTIQNTTVRKAGPSQGNGVTTVFPFTFKVFTATDILVTYLDASGVESVLVLTTNYTVSLNADQNTSPGGSVTLLVAPATGTYITLTSQVTNTQTLALTNSGGFYPESINNALDRTVIQVQQLAEAVSRCITVAVSSTQTTAQLLASIFTAQTDSVASASSATASASSAAASAAAAAAAAGSSGIPSVTGNAGKYLGTNGFTTSWSYLSNGATGGGTDQVFVQNSMIVTTSYSMPSGKSASSVGAITINSGVAITVPSGSRWVVL